jgi:hypothetical protein
LFNIVGRQGVPGKQDIDITQADHLLQKWAAAGVYDGRD